MFWLFHWMLLADHYKALKKTESFLIVLFLRIMNFPNFMVQMTN